MAMESQNKVIYNLMFIKESIPKSLTPPIIARCFFLGIALREKFRYIFQATGFEVKISRNNFFQCSFLLSESFKEIFGYISNDFINLPLSKMYTIFMH